MTIPRLGDLSLASAGIFLLAALATGCGGASSEVREEPIPNVKVIPARLAEVAVQVSVVGTVMPSEISDVASGAEGLVVEYAFREGGYVRKYEALARLESITLEIEIKKAKALLREQEEKHRELTSGYRPEEVAASRARMLAAGADHQRALSRHERLQGIRERSASAVTEEERDEARFEEERTRQTHAEAKADFEMMSAGYRAEQIAAAEAAMQAQVQEVRRLEDELRKHTVPAPFDGFIVAEHTDVGEWVDLGGTVATLVRLDEVEVRVNVEESQVDQIKVGQTVDVRVDALHGAAVPGLVEYIVPKTDWQQGSRSFPVVVRMENRIVDGLPLLKEGMVARITFRGPPRQGLLAHKDAIIRSAGTATVFVVEEDQTVRAVHVTEGLSEGEFIEVQGNLQPDDLLVTEGVELLQPYDEVVVLNPPTADGAGVQPVRTVGGAKKSGASSGG